MFCIIDCVQAVMTKHFLSVILLRLSFGMRAIFRLIGRQ
ncbi:hypothetical protein L581_1510 [Serratia fonticola AU-AP2C]|nr:hypothetical protein L581_1510 [Serratia fonticola AU-AP2C]